MNNIVVVKNLNYNTTRETIEQTFTEAGKVVAVQMPLLREGISKGLAYVTMGDAESARSAVSMFNGFQLEGKALMVHEAQEIDLLRMK